MSKRLRKKKIVTPRKGETAPQERRNHYDGLITEIIDRDLSGKALITRQKARYSCVLEKCLRHERITEAQCKAGLKFQLAYCRAVLHIKVEDVGSTGSRGDPEMGMITCLQSAEDLKAAYAVLSKKQQQVVIDVCGFDRHVDGTNGLHTLQRGLTRLAELWNF